MILWLDGQKVKQGKHDKVYNTETMLPFSEIQGDTIILKDWWLRWIIKVDGINLDLRNGDDLTMVLEQYKKFLNGLNFPLQILVRNTYLDLTAYLTYMKQQVSAITNPTLKEQGDNYVWFMDTINLRQWMIYVKEFYVIVPYYASGEERSQIDKPWRSKILAVLDSKNSAEKVVQKYRELIKNRRFLDTRCNLVNDWLRGIGMSTERVWLPGIISLLFKHYNPQAHSSQADLVEE